ncbi:MAG: NADH dehydrogenase subunit C [Methanomassiliicoccales archaeon PtaU1.Bin124]|nr:MAG: NADH dehydrogenase subunit C [Methanomassiliicoccales archaeon PtaU1.Bin124]
MSIHANDGAIEKIAERQSLENVRLATIITVDKGDGNLELIYVLDVNGALTSINCEFPQDQELASLSSVFAGAENMEREIIDLMGIRFEGIRGGLFLEPGSSIIAPLRKQPLGVK